MSFSSNVDIRWPGSVHDARAFTTSDLYPLCEQLSANNRHLLGDSAYPFNTYLMRPYRKTHRLRVRQKLYNRVLSKTRQVIERAFGFFKNKFRRLFYLNRHSVEDSVSTILACCILHNICLATEVYARILIFGEDHEDNDFENNQEVIQNENANAKRGRIVNELWNLYNE